jgi:hypothetical protein
MKKMICLILLLCANFSVAQNLTPEEQQKLLNDVQEMKAKMNSLESKETGGLKKVNYQSETTEKTSTPTSGASPGVESALTPEQQKKLLEDLAVLKKRQEESKKALEQLDNDE